VFLQPLAACPSSRAASTPTHRSCTRAAGVRSRATSVGQAERREHPFRLLVRDAGGARELPHAFALIDASGVYGQPNWAGDGAFRPAASSIWPRQLSYHPEDVLGLSRARYAGKRTLVIARAPVRHHRHRPGEVHRRAPGTSVVWAMRASPAALFPGLRAPARGRRALYNAARALAQSADPAVTAIGGPWSRASSQLGHPSLSGRPARRRADARRGSGSGHREHRLRARQRALTRVQVHECYASRAPMKLATALLGLGC